MNKWIDSRNQMPPDRAPVWITFKPESEVYPAVFYKGERIDQGSECFSWHVEYPEKGIRAASPEHQYWMLRIDKPASLQLTPEQKRMARYKHTATDLPSVGDVIWVPNALRFNNEIDPGETLCIYVGHETTQVVLTGAVIKGNCFWRAGNLHDIVRGSIHEANKAVWTFSGNTTPFEFDVPMWIYDDKLGVRLAVLRRVEYNTERHGQPVFKLMHDGTYLYGRRYYMPLLYPAKPS